MSPKSVFQSGLIILLIFLGIGVGFQLLSPTVGYADSPPPPLAEQTITTTNAIPPPPATGQIQSQSLFSPLAAYDLRAFGDECAQYIQYASFEYNAGWNHSPANNAYYDNTNAYAGSWSAYLTSHNLTGADSAPAWWQTVSMPADISTAFIQFYALTTQQASGEAFYLSVWDESFSNRLFTTPLTTTISGWNLFEYSLPGSSLAGQNINIVFQIALDDDSSYSELYLDQVALDICVPGSPLPSQEAVQVDQNDDGGQVSLADNQFLVISLEANPSTGYLWEVADQQTDRPLLRQAGHITFESTTAATDSVVGAQTRQLIRLDPLQSGSTTLNLVYRGPASDTVQGQAADTFSIQVVEDGSFLAAEPQAASPLAEAAPPAGSPMPVNQNQSVSPSPLKALADVSLPNQFNWCDQGKCPPVRNQGMCGSCWAFATAGVMETNLKIRDDVFKNLSEQFLVSCNNDNYSCARGGWWAFDYYWNEKSSLGGGPGVVYESSFPYKARDLSCQSGLSHHEKLNSWSQIEETSRPPSVEAIKRAIYDHGPVAVAVCSGPAFHAYQNGIYNTEEKSYCNNWVNHAVVLTGWDDSQQVFYLRNSWGSNWGENGYMRIRYGVSNLGVKAAYVVYNEDETEPDTPPATPTGLRASVSGTTVNLQWTDRSNNETNFYIYKWDGSWQSPKMVGANVTGYTDNEGQCNERYYYLVIAHNDAGYSNWSNMVGATTGSCGSLQPPSNLTAQASSQLVYLRWQDNSSNEDGFLIARWNGVQWEYLPYLGPNTIGYVDRGGRSDYYYVVTTYNNTEGYSNWSNMARATVTMLSSPRNATARTLSNSQIELSWTDSNFSEESYRIERWTGSSWEQIGSTEANQTTYVDTGLQCETMYYYMLYASSPNSYSDYSNLAKATTNPCGDFSIYLPTIMRD